MELLEKLADPQANHTVALRTFELELMERLGYGLPMTGEPWYWDGEELKPWNEEVIESVKALSKTKVAEISAVKLDWPLYAVGACPILVECHWKFNLEPDLTIPSRVAVALMLKQALADWERSDYSLDWEVVSYNMLGSPHGQLSSLFINRETGLKMRKAWQTVCAAGVFGQ